MKKKRTSVVLVISAILLLAQFTGCGRRSAELMAVPDSAKAALSESEDRLIDIQPEKIPLSGWPYTSFSHVTVAAVNNTVVNQLAEIDVSNTQDGYIMVRYLKKIDKTLKVIIKGPGGTPYIYTLRSDGNYDVFPLSEGNGYYQITVFENLIDIKYYAVLATTQSVYMTDEFAPFIRPNQYVNYRPDSNAAKKAAELVKNSKNTVDKIAAIYNYIVKNITYDQQLADSVSSGYIPDVDKVLKNGKGICFDYAAVMTAMLRSQGIPAKLVVGYKGKDYHAWINAYSDETGWIDGAIYFDGKGWKLMDPTFASSCGSKEFLKYIENGNSYSAKYVY